MDERIAELVCELQHLHLENTEFKKKALIKELLSLLPSDIDGIIVNGGYFPKEEKHYLTLDELSEQYNC